MSLPAAHWLLGHPPLRSAPPPVRGVGPLPVDSPGGHLSSWSSIFPLSQDRQMAAGPGACSLSSQALSWQGFFSPVLCHPGSTIWSNLCLGQPGFCLVPLVSAPHGPSPPAGLAPQPACPPLRGKRQAARPERTVPSGGEQGAPQELLPGLHPNMQDREARVGWGWVVASQPLEGQVHTQFHKSCRCFRRCGLTSLAFSPGL